MEPVSVDGSVYLILTPQFYTMRKESIPVRYTYQAKKIAHSFFDGLLEDHEKKYEYFVYKEADSWIFIAYDPEEIISFLRAKGFPLEKVKKVFFAQQVASQIKAPVRLGKQNALTVIDQTATLVPASVLNTEESFRSEMLQLPKKGILLDTGAISIISRKQMVVLSGIFLLFGMLWLVEGWRYGKDNGMLQEKMAQLYEKYPSLQNSYTRENIASKYRKIDTAERKKREIIGKVAGVLFRGVTLNRFEFDNNRFKATFTTSGKSAARRLDGLLKSAGFANRRMLQGNMIMIEGRL